MAVTQLWNDSMTKEEAILLARTHLDEQAKSGASSGHAIRIDQDYFKNNADWLSKTRAKIEAKLGIAFPPIDESAVVPHWFVSFTFVTREAGAATLKHTGMKIYDDGRVERLPTV